MTPECVHDYTPKDMPVCDEAFGASQKMQCTKFYVTRKDDDMIFECAMCRCRWSLEGFLM